MIDEVRLQAAAKEATEAILKTLPPDDAIQYTPSTFFTKRIKKLIYRVEHPILYYGVRSAACLLALALSGSILLFGISSDVRAAVLGWFKQLREGTHFEYDFEGENTVDMTGVRYETSWVPEGFVLIMQEYDDSGGLYAYSDISGYVSNFSYMFAKIEGDQKLLVDGKQPYYEHSVIEVMGYKADCYMLKDNEHSSTLVWIDKNDTLFTVTAMLTKEELIKWSESIIEIRE